MLFHEQPSIYSSKPFLPAAKSFLPASQSFLLASQFYLPALKNPPYMPPNHASKPSLHVSNPLPRFLTLPLCFPIISPCLTSLSLFLTMLLPCLLAFPPCVQTPTLPHASQHYPLAPQPILLAFLAVPLCSQPLSLPVNPHSFFPTLHNCPEALPPCPRTSIPVSQLQIC